MLRTLQVNHGHTNYARYSVLCCSFGTAVSCTTKLVDFSQSPVPTFGEPLSASPSNDGAGAPDKRPTPSRFQLQPTWF